MERGITERVRALRKRSTTTQPRLYLERARLETEAYKKYEGKVSVPELRALALLYYFTNKTISIGEGELIVGDKGLGPQSAPTFPELCCHSLEDMEVMGKRELISFTSTQEDRALQRDEIIPFWQQRSMRTKMFNILGENWKNCYHAGIFTEFMEQRGPGHTVGSDKIYQKGFMDYKQDILDALNALDYQSDASALSRAEELRAMNICCDAIITLGRRYGELARKLAGEEQDEVRRGELIAIAENCEVVPKHRPRTFYQALQLYWFVHLGVTSELNPWDAYSPGRLDQHLNPFYQADIEAGRLDREGALELLECLWVKFNDQPAPPKVGITLRESCTYTDFANINTGGITPCGEDGVNDVSYLILDCMDEMRLLQPSSNVQISRKTPRRFLKRACEISRQGWGQPAFYNTEAIVAELMAAGKSLDDARVGGTSGCVETGAFGSEAYILTGYFNIPKVLELTLNNGYDKVSKQQLGLQLGADFKSYDELFAAFKKQLKYFIDIKTDGSNRIEALYANYMPAPFLSIITNDCIARGRDYNAGGARYNTSYLQGVGIGTVTDSLASIKKNVYDDKNFTMRELQDALDANFEGEAAKRIYSFCRDKAPCYGNDDDYADDIMQAVFRAYRDTVTGRPNTRGGTFRVNMLPTTCHVYFGEVMTASANGRLAGKPVSEGISPTQGADVCGPTAVLRSAAKMDQLTTGGTLLNQKFTPDVLASERGLDSFADLIRTYFNLDGHHVQFNVVDRETLLAAQQNPDEYRDLIVRVAGYSDYFRNLSRALQDEIIERTQQSL